MKINADFDKRVLVHSADMDWVNSPMAGVSRRPLDRVGDEVARATTIVKYEAGSKFSPHVHTGGEEFVVLEGVFQDEHGDFGVGSYIRNPPQSSHTPGSELGCVIFVKLWQFDPEDRTHVRLNTKFMKPVPVAHQPGVRITPLYVDEREEVNLQQWAAGTEVSIKLEHGAEILVLEGSISESGDSLTKHSWLRVPAGESISAIAGDSGATIWLKMNHLADVREQIALVEAV